MKRSTGIIIVELFFVTQFFLVSDAMAVPCDCYDETKTPTEKVMDCTPDCASCPGGYANCMGENVYPAAEGAATTPQAENTAGVGSTTLDNPLPSPDPRVIIGNIINAMLGIVGSLALAVFIFGGFTWVTSAGNDEKIKKGKDMVMWAAMGLALIFTSYAIIGFVLNAITGPGGGATSGNNVQTIGDNNQTVQ
jgi:hypothetical protein